MQYICPIHGITKFSVNKTENVSYCVRCHSAKVKRERRSKLKQKAIEYKGGKCSKCGYNNNNNALEFHHVDPFQKEFSISTYALGKPWKVITEELDKCILLCANCHREIHSFIK